MHIVDSKIPQISREVGDLRLVVIDSIAGPIRSGDLENDVKERNVALHRLGSSLHSLAFKLNIPILVANQVATNFLLQLQLWTG